MFDRMAERPQVGATTTRPLPLATMPRSRPLLRCLALLLGAVVLLVGGVVAVPAGAQEPAPDANPSELAPEAPPVEGAVPLDDAGEPVAPPAGAQASGLDRLAQLLTAPRPIAKAVGFVAPEPAPPSGPPYRSGPAPDSPVIIPPPAVGPGDGTVYAVGDSVLLGTESYLGTTVGGWDLRLDARVSRRFPEGIDLVRANRDRLGQAVVICLGHNYGGGGSVYSYLDQLMVELRNVERVVFVTVAEWSPAQPEVNRAIRALPSFYPNVVVADWAGVSAANPPFLVSDRVHLSRSGNIALANLIAVMLGPANKDGTTVAPPRILTIPDEPGGTTSPTSSSTSTSTTSTSTTVPGTGTTTTTAPPDTTTTTLDTTTTTDPGTTTTASTATSMPP